MSDRQLKPERMQVKEVVTDLQKGELLLPEFQRDYVWKPSKAAKLLDSMYRKFPVGSLLVWQTENDVQARSNTRRGGSFRSNWLIDGQQRCRTLEKIKHDDGLDVRFNVVEERFERANPTNEKDPRFVRVADVWSESDFPRVRSDIAARFPREQAEYERRLDRCRNILLYEIPKTVMIGHDFDEAVDVFQRLNSLGVRLGAKDLESAKLASRHAGFIRDHVLPFVSQLENDGFKRLSLSHLFRAASAIAQKAYDKPHLETLSARDLDSVWKKVRDGFDTVRQMLGAEIGLGNMSLIWSGAVLVPPIVIVATSKLPERNPKEIVAWIAAASLFGRYSGSAVSALDQDLKACLRAKPLQGLLTNLRKFAKLSRLQSRPVDFGGSLRSKGARLAVYVACHHKGLLDLRYHQKVRRLTPKDKVQDHHLFPKATFKPEERMNADALANISFIDRGSNLEISATPAATYLANVPKEVLDSQCIPTDPSLYAMQYYVRFCNARKKLLSAAFNEYLSDSKFR